MYRKEREGRLLSCLQKPVKHSQRSCRHHAHYCVCFLLLYRVGSIRQVGLRARTSKMAQSQLTLFLPCTLSLRVCT